MAKYYRAQYNAQSETDPDKTYKVSQRGDYPDVWECSCKAWIFQRKRLHNGQVIPKHEVDYLPYAPNGYCKHIMEIRAERNLDEDARTYAETGEKIEVCLDGRIDGLIDNLK